MKTAKMMYYGTKFAFWSAVANILDDLFLTSMIIIVGSIVWNKL